jgi:hypothetical protein
MDVEGQLLLKLIISTQKELQWLVGTQEELRWLAIVLETAPLTAGC